MPREPERVADGPEGTTVAALVHVAAVAEGWTPVQAIEGRFPEESR